MTCGALPITSWNGGWPRTLRSLPAGLSDDTKARHGYALLWDAHSIISELPRFFKGKLTDLNLGTADAKS